MTNDQRTPEPAPEDFEWDHDRLMILAAEVLATEEADHPGLLAALADDELVVIGELDGDGVPWATVTDDATGSEFALFACDWRVVCRVVEP